MPKEKVGGIPGLVHFQASHRVASAAEAVTRDVGSAGSNRERSQ